MDSIQEEARLVAYEAEIESEQAYFGLCWPNACKACGGWGLHSWRGPHGEQLSDPCTGESFGKGCTADLYCARCGESGLGSEGEGPCIFCGWNYDDGMPSLY